MAVKHMPMSSLIIGIDLDPIRAIKGCTTLVGDITTQKSRQAIKKEAGGSLMDSVIHDGAPNVGGAWASEAYSQSWLVLEALKLACEFLAPRGTFVTKIFRSQDYNALLYAFNQLFAKVEATKPAASRNTSAEIFVVCLGYKAPSKIDPRLLDAKYIFRDVSEAPRNMGPDALLKQKIKQKRFREGYEEGLSTMHKPTSAAAFILSSTPVEMLGQFSQIAVSGPVADSFPGAELAPDFARFVEKHPATVDEVKALCQDLQVLGRSEFKQLLKWRVAVKKAWAVHLAELQQKQQQGSDTEEEEAQDAEPSPADAAEAAEDAIMAEMAQVKAGMERRQKREKRKKLEQKKKARVRAAQAVLGEGINTDTGNEHDALFSLAALKGKGSLADLADVSAPAEHELEDYEADSDENVAQPGENDSDAEDSDEEERREEMEIEEDLDAAYQGYLQRQGVRAEAARQKRKRLGMEGELGSDEEADPNKPEYEPGSDAEEPQEQPGEGLLVELDERRIGRATSGAVTAAQWFAQDLFNDADLSEEDADTPAPVTTKKKAKQAQHAVKPTLPAQTAAAALSAPAQLLQGGEAMPAAAAAAAARPVSGESAEQSSDADSDGSLPSESSSSDGEGEEQQASAAAGMGMRSDNFSHSGFEEVPVSRQHGEGSSDESSDDGFDDLDDDGRAEVLALAKKMLKGRDRQDILDNAYHKYAFHETGLPRWFEEDEKRHMKPPVAISQEEVQAEKDRLRAIDARPIKKVAEAKARKQKRMASKMEAARAKAEAISGQEDLPMGSKMKEIQKLMAKARATGKGKTKKKATRSDQYKKSKPMDKRMFSDKRAVNFKAKKKAAKKSKPKGKKNNGNKTR